MQDILKILQFVHENKVIHRDIKPSNLIRRVDSKIFLIDFGAVKEITTLAITDSGKITPTIAIGTPGYIAPEQGHGNPRPNSDIYSLGIMGIQALTGLDPNNFPSDPQTSEKIWNYSLSNQETVQVSRSLERILNKMVRYDFKQRYQSATEVLTDLENLINPSPILVDRMLVKKPPNLPVWIPGLALVGVFGGLILGISMFSYQTSFNRTTSNQDNPSPWCR